MAKGKSRAAVCAEIGISRQTLLNWENSFPEFKETIQIGAEKGQAYWEGLGHDGVIGAIEKFGSAPWIFTMKNRFRNDYADDKKEEKSESTSLLEKLITGEIKVSHD